MNQDQFLNPIPDEQSEQEQQAEKDTFFFDLLGSISETKIDYSKDPRFDKAYEPWSINSYFSRFLDTIMTVNELNRFPLIPKHNHYRYLLNTISKKKRYAKDPKVKNDDLESVSSYYRFSLPKAAAALRLLKDDQLKIIKQKLNKGGNKNVGR